MDVMEKLAFYFILFVAFCGKDILCKRRDHKLKEDGGKIVGGNSTNIEAYPYQAYLLLYDGRNYYQCGGSIVSQYYIVTAAHCLTRIQKIYVRIGSTYSNSGGSEYVTKSFSSHPKYNSRTSDYDVGLVKIKEGMNLNRINAKAISMVGSNSDVATGEKIVISGWGTTSENGDTSTTLMVVSVPAVARAQCNHLFGGGITTRMFCAGLSEGGKDTCQGDSGGPAVAGGKLHGITSFGYGCARSNSPGVYTRIGEMAVRSFIKRITGI